MSNKDFGSLRQSNLGFLEKPPSKPNKQKAEKAYHFTD